VPKTRESKNKESRSKQKDREIGEKDQEFKRWYESGLSIREIAKKAGTNYSAVRRALLRTKVKFRGRIDSSTEEMVVKMGKEGLSASKISRELKLNFNTVSRILKKHGLGRSRRKLTKEQIDEILNSRRRGESIYSIAKKLGVSTNLVAYHLKHSSREGYPTS
jgi:DNA-binding CsgD family transcriptional regulator